MANKETDSPDEIKKNSLPVSNFTIVVIVAVLIALGLIALGLFAYNSADDTKDSNDQTTELTETVEEDEPVGDPAAELEADDIDEELQQLDEDLNQLDEESDFDENSLDDEQLGL